MLLIRVWVVLLLAGLGLAAVGQPADDAGAEERLAEAERLDAEAVARYHAGDHEEAGRLFARALEIRQQVLGPEHPTLAVSLGILSGLRYAAGDVEGSRELSERQVGILEKSLGAEHPQVVEILDGIWAMLQHSGDPAGALPFAERAIAAREKALGAGHPDLAFELEKLMFLYQDLGDRDAALDAQQRAVEIRERTPGHPPAELAVALTNLAGARLVAGELEAAGAAYEKALAIREEVFGRDHVETAKSLNNLALARREAGDLAAARGLYERAAAIFEQAVESDGSDGSNGPDAAYLGYLGTVLNNLGALHLALGDLEAARRDLERALEIVEQTLGPEDPEVASTLNNLSSVFWRADDLEAAFDHQRRALEISERALGAEDPEVATLRHNLGSIAHSRGDLEAAAAAYRRALETFERALGPRHPKTAEALNSLGALRHQQGDLEAGREALERALEIRREVLGPDHPDTALTLENLALLHLARGEVDRALDLAERALEAQERQLEARMALGSEDERRLYLRTYLSSTLTAVSIHAQFAPDDPRALELALTTLLRRKARDLDAGVEIPRRPRHEPVTLDAVRARIPPRAALVEIVLYAPFDPATLEDGKPRYAAYVLRRSGAPRWVDLDLARRVDLRVENLRHALAEEWPEVERPARELDAVTMARIRPLLGDAEELLLSPDFALQLVPFAALVDEEGRYLIERYGLSYVTSGRDLLRPRGPAPRQPPLVVGDVAFGHPPDPVRGDERLSPVELDDLRFGPLPGTAAEARAIARIFRLPGERLLTGKAATETAVKAVRGPRFLHLATHGFFLHAPAPAASRQPAGRGPDPALPRLDPLLRSGLALAGFHDRRRAGREKDASDDGVLTALEVASLDLEGTEMAVLSACETGRGEVRAGEAVAGLRRALVLAGARTQLLTLWQVADEPTRELMESWYRQLERGAGRAEALRRAQLAALRDQPLPVTGARLPPHPYSWAGFLLAGDTGPLP